MNNHHGNVAMKCYRGLGTTLGCRHKGQSVIVPYPELQATRGCLHGPEALVRSRPCV